MNYVCNIQTLKLLVILFKSITYRPFNEPEFHNMRPYLEPNFPHDYPFSQSVNNEGELVYTPWRDSEDLKYYCRSHYANENEVAGTNKCEMKSIQQLNLLTQYSSEDSSDDSDDDEEEQF